MLATIAPLNLMDFCLWNAPLALITLDVELSQCTGSLFVSRIAPNESLC